MLLLSNALRNSEDKQDRTIIKGQQDSSKSAAHSLMALETQYHHVLARSLKKHFSTEESEILTHTHVHCCRWVVWTLKPPLSSRVCIIISNSTVVMFTPVDQMCWTVSPWQPGVTAVTPQMVRGAANTHSATFFTASVNFHFGESHICPFRVNWLPRHVSPVHLLPAPTVCRWLHSAPLSLQG